MVYAIYAASQHFFLEMLRCGMYIGFVISALLPDALQKLKFLLRVFLPKTRAT